MAAGRLSLWCLAMPGAVGLGLERADWAVGVLALPGAVEPWCLVGGLGCDAGWVGWVRLGMASRWAVDPSGWLGARL